jgi:hypothetical protein
MGGFWRELFSVSTLSSRQIFSGGGHGELAVFDAFGGNQLVGNFFDKRCLAAHHQHFQAIMVVKVNVDGGNNDFVMVMLNVGQRGLDIAL